MCPCIIYSVNILIIFCFPFFVIFNRPSFYLFMYGIYFSQHDDSDEEEDKTIKQDAVFVCARNEDVVGCLEASNS